MNFNYSDYFERRAEVCGGSLVVKGTRVPVRTLLASLAEGAAVEEIRTDFPTVSEEVLRAVIAFAAARAALSGEANPQRHPLNDPMKAEDQYLKFVRWSDDDGAYIGFCPELFPWGGVCHGADEEQTYHTLRELVREEIADLQAAGRELPAATTRPMCEPAGV